MHAARNRKALTLAELTVSMVIMSLLVGAAASAVVLATRALPSVDREDLLTADAAAALDQMARDLAVATAFSSPTPTSITLSVPDRGHGAGGDEKIKYDWGGSAGDALTRTYNDVAPVELIAAVDDLTLDYAVELGELDHAPRVLVVTNDVASAQTIARLDLIESWGFAAEPIAATASASALAAARARSDVIYISRESSLAILAISSMLSGLSAYDTPAGIVTEMPESYPFLRLAGVATFLTSDTSIDLVDNAHEITAPFSIGTLTICSTTAPVTEASGTIAPGAAILATRLGNPSIMAAEPGAEMIDGSLAPGRRAKLPWGQYGFDINDLTENGHTIMRRAIVWAAAPPLYTSVNIRLDLGLSDVAPSQTRVTLLNQPTANIP